MFLSPPKNFCNICRLELDPALWEYFGHLLREPIHPRIWKLYRYELISMVSRYLATAAFQWNFCVIDCCSDCAAAGSPCVKYTCFGGTCKPASHLSNSLFPACALICPI